jgi:hypothetical protein
LLVYRNGVQLGAESRSPSTGFPSNALEVSFFLLFDLRVTFRSSKFDIRMPGKWVQFILQGVSDRGMFSPIPHPSAECQFILV